jgi:glutathione S-transferase
MLSDYGYVARTFGGGLVYRAMLPLAGGLIRRGNGITGQEAVEDGRRANLEALDLVAAAVARTGYIVGSSFTVADLTAASQLATLACPDHPDARRPEPEPAKLAAVLAPLLGHPAIAWTKRMYALHRPQQTSVGR